MNLPQNVNAIGENAFGGCRLLKKVILPEQLSKLEDYTFDRCEGLEKIYIPAKIRSIGNYALATNRPLDIYYGGTLDVWNRIPQQKIGLTSGTKVYCEANPSQM